jgi:hypothetical protein
MASSKIEHLVVEVLMARITSAGTIVEPQNLRNRHLRLSSHYTVIIVDLEIFREDTRF